MIMAKQQTMIRLEPGLKKELQTAAARHQRSLSGFIANICFEWTKKNPPEEKDQTDARSHGTQR